MRLPDGHFIRIPHGAEKRRRSSGRSTPLYYLKISECTKIGGLLAETTDTQAIKKLINFWDITDAQIEQIEFHTDWGIKTVLYISVLNHISVVHHISVVLQCSTLVKYVNS